MTEWTKQADSPKDRLEEILKEIFEELKHQSERIGRLEANSE